MQVMIDYWFVERTMGGGEKIDCEFSVFVDLPLLLWAHVFSRLKMFTDLPKKEQRRSRSYFETKLQIRIICVPVLVRYGILLVLVLVL